MATAALPLLLFPRPAPVRRQGLPTPDVPRPQKPSLDRQGERLGPKFQNLLQAMANEAVAAHPDAENPDPDLVLVLETVGAINDFISSANRIEGLEWLFGEMTTIDPDEDFFFPDDPEKKLGGRLFLMGVTRAALEQIVRLWDMFRGDPDVHLPDGLSAWKQVFPLLKDVRFWGPQDRITDDVRQYWEERAQAPGQVARFEIEAWCYASEARNAAAANEVRRLVANLGGRVINSQLLEEISYHGFLVEIPPEGLADLLSETPPGLVLSARVMYFRAQGQAVALPQNEADRLAEAFTPRPAPTEPPKIGMLDGLPLANHPRLAGRVVVDDPDGWSAEYPANERVHGTAVASLIVWGDLSAEGAPIGAPLYARPIMRPDPLVGPPTLESTPDDQLLVDLVHRAVRRMFEGDGNTPPQASAVRVINLSVGDKARPFDGTFVSPWARLLDWLSFKYNVLFVVSAGNSGDDLALPVARESIGTLERADRATAAVRSLLQADMHRRILTPAESLNSLTWAQYTLMAPR